MHDLHKTKFLNHNQTAFIPQKSTTDEAMTVKQFIGPELERRVVIMTSLDVKGAFDDIARIEGSRMPPETSPTNTRLLLGQKSSDVYRGHAVGLRIGLSYTTPSST